MLAHFKLPHKKENTKRTIFMGTLSFSKMKNANPEFMHQYIS